MALPPVQAETWKTIYGEQCEGTLTGVYGPTAIISSKTLVTRMSLDRMDDVGLARIADYLAARSAAPQAWSASTSKVAKSIKGTLQVLKDGKLVKFDPGTRAEPEVYLAYFGAGWCGPCRRFSPRLVEAYAQLKKIAPDYFEVIFISSDRDSDEQLGYVSDVHMPWPVLRYSSLGRAAPLEQWTASGIPSLVAVTRDGDLLYHSYAPDNSYLGPDTVLKQFTELMKASLGKSDEVKRARHRLAVLQYLKTTSGGAAAVKPYLIQFDPSRYRTLELKEFTAKLSIDDHGKVLDAQFEPQLPTVLEDQLTRDAGSWLFLPAIEAGQAKAVRVQLPISLKG